MQRFAPSLRAPLFLASLTLGLGPLGCTDGGGTTTTESDDGTTSTSTTSTSTTSMSTSGSDSDQTSADGPSDGSSTAAEDSTSAEDSSSSGGAPGVTFDQLEACLDELVTSPQIAGASAAVMLGDELVWSQGFGVRHPDGADPVDTQTRFRVGSVTKMMTGMATLSLVDDGVLEVDTPLADLLPPFGPPANPEWTAALTPRQLLSHQGGLVDYLTIDGPREDEALAEAVLGELFTLVPYMVEPGLMWNYSNANYSVAGMVVEEAAGVPYREAIQQRVFAPLQMERSTFDVEDVEADGNYAHGIAPTGVFGALDYDNAWGRPAGYAWSTAEDLTQLTRFLRSGDEAVMSAAAHEEMVSPVVDTLLFLDHVHYGYGLFHTGFIPSDEGFYEVSTIDHGGNLNGYTTSLMLIPEYELSIAIIASGDNQDLNPCTVAALHDLPEFSLEPVVPDTQADQTDLTAYPGDYSDIAGTVGDFTITAGLGGALEINFPLLDGMSIPYSPDLQLIGRDNFLIIIQGFPLQLTGIFDERGTLTHVRNRVFVGHAVSEAEPPAPMSVSPSRTRALLDGLQRDRSPRFEAIARAVRARR